MKVEALFPNIFAVNERRIGGGTHDGDITRSNRGAFYFRALRRCFLLDRREPHMKNISDFYDREIRPLLRPSSAFAHPRDVVDDPDLTTYEKRAILSSWASDACAVESCPTVRRLPGSQGPVTFEEVLDALKSLDDDPTPSPGGTSARSRSPRDGPDSNQVV